MLPEDLREFDDTSKARKWMYSNALEALENRFPVESGNRRLELSDLKVDDKPYSLDRQKRALMSDEKLRVPVKGKWRLVDNKTGDTIEEREDTIMRIPYLTDRGTMIYRGNEYSNASQSRLKPGVYSRTTRTGRPEAMFNTRSGTGKNFRMYMLPSTGVFKVRMGQANIPAYGLLKAAGISDEKMRESWGDDLYDANLKAARNGDERRIAKFLGGLGRNEELEQEEMRRRIRESLGNSSVDRTVMQKTMGVDRDHIDDKVLMRATSRLLGMSRGDEEGDDRDAPMFSEVYGIEDHIADRINKDAGRTARNIAWKAGRRGLSKLPAGALDPYVEGYMHGSRLTNPLEETNPLSLREQMYRITKMGEGGIGDPNMVTESARQVNAGQLGFIDPIAGPEGCMPPDSEVMTRSGWMRWDEVGYDTEFACMVDGTVEYHNPEKMHVYDWDGPMYGAKSKFVSYLVTSHHKLWVRPYDDEPLKYRFEYAHLTHNKPRKVRTGGHGPYEGESKSEFFLPDVAGGNAMKHFTDPIDMTLWAEFMGWYLSEGHARVINGTQGYVTIAQHEGEHLEKLRSIMERMPMNFHSMVDSEGVMHGFQTTSKQLAVYLKQFGGSHDKYIPEYLFEAPVEARKALLRSMCWGDGRKKGATYTYCSSSRRLVMDFERLAFGLGYSVRTRFEKDDRPQSLTGGCWCAHLHLNNERVLIKGHRTCKGNYYTEYYTGKVYCATVPGGLMYCRRGDYGGHWSGNTSIGLDTRAAYRTFKGKDRRMYSEFKNRDGKTEMLSPDDLDGKNIAFPGQMESDSKWKVGVKNGKMGYMRPEEIDYEIPSMAHMYADGFNMVPMPTSYMPGRAFYGSKFWGQYLPPAEGERPLVDSLTPDGERTFSEEIGNRMGTLKSPSSGEVVKVSDDKVTVKDDDGERHDIELVKNFPFNRQTGLTFSPTVEEGDRVPRGGTVANSNYTDPETGEMRLGRNLKAAMVPYGARAFEDALVLSEDAAKKMATQRLYGYEREARHGVELGRDRYASVFPEKLSKDQMEKLDENGMAKPGVILEKGDPVVLAVGPKLLGPEDMQLGRLHKVLRQSQTDKSLVWEHDYPGEVVDSKRTRSGAKVNIKASPPVTKGDKAASRLGIKGVVGSVIPNDKMPRDPTTDEPYDIMFNPMTIQSRIAPAQIMTMKLAKLAKKKGEQIRLPQDPPEEGWNSWVDNKLKEEGLDSEAGVFDPDTGKTIEGVSDGYIYMMPMHHLSEKKHSVRGGPGMSYDANMQPATGGDPDQKAKRMGRMGNMALLSHGAKKVLEDVQTTKGDMNPEYWKALRLGLPLPEPKVPFAYEKFLDLMKGGGVNIRDNGKSMSLLPMTDRSVQGLSNGKIENSGVVDNDMEPVKGGLLDEGRTGGLAGTKWSHIELDEPYPNPVFEEPIRRVLGLKKKELKDIIAGAEPINGKRGGKALAEALSNVDRDEELKKARKEIETSRGAARDDAIKRVKYLSALKEQDMTPEDWMMSKVPVVPPVMRPVSRLGDMILQSDMNELYRDVMESDEALRELKGELPDDALGAERMNVYGALTAAMGLGESITPEGRAKKLKGSLKQIIGEHAKHGLFQGALVSKPQDLSGRGVVTPNPNLNMDQIGIPEDAAWTTYKDFVTRNLARRNFPAHKIANMIEERDPRAKAVLQEEMTRRPVLISRSPAWHKYNLMAFYPHMVEDDTIHVPPVTVGGFNMDFDGDKALNTIYLAIPESQISKINENYYLQYTLSRDIVRTMINNKQIPVLDHDHEVMIMDLEDFPHGKLLENCNGEKGPIDLYEAIPGTKVIALDEETGLPEWKEVSHYSKHHQREVEIVNLTNNKQIWTDDDPRAVYGVDPSADGLKFVRGTPSDAYDRNIVVPYSCDCSAGMEGAVDTVSVPDGARGAWKDLELTEDVGYMFGALAGDGWWDHKNYGRNKKRIYLSDSSGHVAAKLKECLLDVAGDEDLHCMKQEAFKTADNNRYGDAVKYTFSCKSFDPFVNYLDHTLGGERTEKTAGSGSKHLPGWAFTAPRECKYGMLCGLIDTDGTCSISRAKNKDQLMISFTSTSMRLCREVSLLCRSVGISASVSYSKKTTRGNDSWIVTLSTVDAKRLGVFDGLASDAKRENFVNTKVSNIPQQRKNKRVVLPDYVSDFLLKAVGSPKHAETPEQMERKSVYMGLWKGAKTKTVSRYVGVRAVEMCRESTKNQELACDRARSWLDGDMESGDIERDDAEMLKDALRAIAPARCGHELYDTVRKLIVRINGAARKGTITEKIKSDVRSFLTDRRPAFDIDNRPEIVEWMNVVLYNEKIDWTSIESVEKTGKTEDGYDLTVPGHETFMAMDGVILSNTSNFYVPASDKAVEEAKEKMLPSKNLFRLTDLRSAQYTPTQEYVLGINRMSEDPKKDKQPRKFPSYSAARRAYAKGLIDLNDPIEIAGDEEGSNG